MIIIKIIKQQKTKLLSFLLVVSLLFGIFAIAPMSASATIGDEFSYNNFSFKVTDEIGSNAVTLVKAENIEGSVVIPGTVSNDGKSYNVTSMSDNLFANNANITSVNIPGTMTTIPVNAFSKCTGINEVILNDGIQVINSSAFAGDTSLKEISIPKSVTNVNNYAFNGCTSLETVHVYGNTTFAAMALRNSSIKDFWIHNSSTPIPGAANFNSVNDVKFHVLDGSTAYENAQSKGYTVELFSEAEPTTDPNVTTEPDTSEFKWERINDGSAIKITGLKEEFVNSKATLVIPPEINETPVTTIDKSAFSGNRILKNIEFPASVTLIDDQAFYNCSQLSEVKFPDDSQLVKIGNRAFGLVNADVSHLNEISLPKSLKLIGYQAFVNRSTLVNVYIYSKDAIFGDSVLGAEIFDIYEGGSQDSGSPHAPSSALKIYCSGNSTAEEYALENGITVRYLDLDTTELQAAYDRAQAIDSTQYTAASYASLTSAMTTANRVLKNKNATQAEVNAALAALNEALDKLVPIGGSETTAPTESSTSATESSSASEYVDVLIGDTNGDGRVSVQDATAIQAHIVNLTPLTGVPYVAADVNEDERITVIDATLVQKYIVDQIEEGNHTGETAQKPLPTEPQPTDPPTTTEPPTGRFYMPNDVKWLNEYGAMIWIYNNKTEEYFVIEGYDEDAGVFYTDNLPADWTDIGFYRTPFETTEETFESGMADYKATGQVYNETDHPDTCILNVWKDLADRGTSNCFQVLADGVGSYTTYDPNVEVPTERTLYFDNSTAKWGSVYFYSWSYNGLRNETAEMEFEGNNIWSITIYEELPKDNVQGFLFVSKEILNGTDGSEWGGASQTVDLATEAGKNIFIPSGRDGQGKYGGSWGVYNPETGEIIS